MSKKPKNRNKKRQHHRDQTRRELEELIRACNQGLDTGYVAFYGLVQRYKMGKYRTELTDSKLVVVDDYIRTAQTDLTSLDTSLKSISSRARELVKNYTNAEDNLMGNLTLSQDFENWSTSYQSNITPTLLELAAYLDDLDNLLNLPETCNEQ